MDQSEFDALVAMKDCSQTVEKKKKRKKKRRKKMMLYGVHSSEQKKRKLLTFEAIYTGRAQ